VMAMFGWLTNIRQANKKKITSHIPLTNEFTDSYVM